MSDLVIDPGAALIVVDLQVATTSAPTAHDPRAVVARVLNLVTAFHDHELTVVYTQVDLNHRPAGRTSYDRPRPPVPDEALELVPELTPQADDIVLTKSGWGAFGGTDLDQTLRGRGVTQVVVTGLATGYGVESTARQAYDTGYDVLLVTDAMTDPRPDEHTYSIANVFPALGRTATTADVLADLATRTSPQ